MTAVNVNASRTQHLHNYSVENGSIAENGSTSKSGSIAENGSTSKSSSLTELHSGLVKAEDGKLYPFRGNGRCRQCHAKKPNKMLLISGKHRVAFACEDCFLQNPNMCSRIAILMTNLPNCNACKLNPSDTRGFRFDMTNKDRYSYTCFECSIINWKNAYVKWCEAISIPVIAHINA